jgi:phage terminase Nu1 subunit (DNA packaging protein)
MELKSSEFANLIGVSQRQVNNYRKEGMPSIKKNKYYYYNFDAIQWLYDNGIKQVKRITDEAQVQQLSIRERKDLAEAKIKEFELAVKQGKYYLKDEVKSYSINLGVQIREIISSIPDRFIPRLELDEDIKHYLRVELKEEMYQTLIKLRDLGKGT